jgi:Protein of unknown function (DUF3379)
MNCLEFRRQLGADPQSADAQFLHHRQECAGCAEAFARATGFETALRRAMEISAPAQLAESILLAQATREQGQRQVYRRNTVLALAASVVLAFGIGMRVQAEPLTSMAVDHLREEAATLTLTKAVAPQSVREAFATRGITLTDVPEGVSFVGCCPMGHHLTVHLVMRDSNQPITVIYVVDQRDPSRADFQREGWRGRSVPLGSGTLILLAQDSTGFDEVEKAWRTAIGNASGATHS